MVRPVIRGWAPSIRQVPSPCCTMVKLGQLTALELVAHLHAIGESAVRMTG